MGAAASVGGDRGPLVVQHAGAGLAKIYHRLNRENHAFAQTGTLAAGSEVRDLRFFVQLGPDTVSHELANDTEAVGFYKFLHGRTDIADRVADSCLLDALVQRSFSYFEQLANFRLDRLIHRDCDGSVAVVSIENHAAIDGNDVARFQHPFFRRNAMHDFFVHRGAKHARIIVITLECGLRAQFPDHFLAIIAAGYQRRTVNIADIRNARWLEIDVIDVSVGETSPASSEPLYQLIIVHVDADHNWQTLATLRIFKDLALEKSVQPARLSGGARKPIQDEPALAIRVADAPGHHVANQIVRHQFTASHQSLGLHAQLGAALHIRPQNVSGGDLRDAVMFGHALGLCALARARRTEQHDRPDV